MTLPRVGVLVLGLLTMAACAGGPDVRGADGDADAERRLHTGLVRGMLAQGQYYAALAHIEEQKNRGPRSLELRFLEAEALRKLDRRGEALELYRSLLGSIWSGRAHHGLGLLHAPVDLERAVYHLRLAVRKRPTDVEARNDLGYALLLSRRYAEARAQLATAVELNPEDPRGRHNLLLVLLLQKDESAIAQLRAQAAVPDPTWAELRREARALQAARPPSH